MLKIKTKSRTDLENKTQRLQSNINAIMVKVNNQEQKQRNNKLAIEREKTINENQNQMIDNLQAIMITKETRLDALTNNMVMQNKSVAFHATRKGSRFGLKSGKTLVFNTVSVNIGSAYHPSNGSFVCPLSGLYHFSLHAICRWASPHRVHLNSADFDNKNPNT